LVTSPLAGLRASIRWWLCATNSSRFCEPQANHENKLEIEISRVAAKRTKADLFRPDWSPSKRNQLQLLRRLLLFPEQPGNAIDCVRCAWCLARLAWDHAACATEL